MAKPATPKKAAAKVTTPKKPAAPKPAPAPDPVPVAAAPPKNKGGRPRKASPTPPALDTARTAAYFDHLAAADTLAVIDSSPVLDPDTVVVRPGGTVQVHYHGGHDYARAYVRDFIDFGKARLRAMFAELDALDAMFPPTERVDGGSPCACELRQRAQDKADAVALGSLAAKLHSVDTAPPPPIEADDTPTGNAALDDLV